MTAPTNDRVVTGLLRTVVVAVAIQAVLAGQFISGLAPLVVIHGVVGTVLELVGLALAVAAIVQRRRSDNRSGRSLAALLLGLALLVQSGLGHAPGAVPTAVHVPLGVAIFAWATVLALAPHRPPRSHPAQHDTSRLSHTSPGWSS